MARSAAPDPGWSLVLELFAEGHALVAGLDEVGRGAWAGPVVVGVVVVDDACVLTAPAGVRDSKLLSPPSREALFAPLARWCRASGIGEATAQECDALGMTAAQRLAARRALAALAEAPDALVVDGKWEYTGIAGARAVVGADRTCYPVAAASVLAKVTRDRQMVALAAQHPGYGFERHKGYVAPEHRHAVATLGMTTLHRRSWSVVPRDPSGSPLPGRTSDAVGGL